MQEDSVSIMFLPGSKRDQTSSTLSHRFDRQEC
jgi:hypothetical protein